MTAGAVHWNGPTQHACDGFDDEDREVEFVCFEAQIADIEAQFALDRDELRRAAALRELLTDLRTDFNRERAS